MRRLLLLPLGLAACGLGNGSGGGDDNLPTSGAGPYGKLTDFDLKTPVDEPIVIGDFGADLEDASPVARAGGAIRVFYTRRAGGGAPEVWRSDLASLAVPPSATSPVLSGASAPSVVEDGSRLVLFHEDGAGGIARADSTDGGETFGAATPVLADARQPGALRTKDRWWLYFTRPATRGIFLATSTDGMNFNVREAPVIDLDASEPAAAGGDTAAGTGHIGLFFTAPAAEGLVAIRYAGSADGLSFVVNPEPILDPRTPDERGPGVLLEPSRSVLFFSQQNGGHWAIGAATSP